MGISHPFLTGAINTELRSQADHLDDFADSLADLEVRIKAAPGSPTVLDTNVLLHYQPPEQIKWTEVVGANEVRLILPLRVIEELDEKKYLGRSEIRDRARDVISRLWSLLVPTAGAPVALREQVTIELPIETGVRVRPLDADQEVLDTCGELQAIGQPVVLVTADTGLACRATGRGLKVQQMPDAYLRDKRQSAPEHSADRAAAQ